MLVPPSDSKGGRKSQLDALFKPDAGPAVRKKPLELNPYYGSGGDGLPPESLRVSVSSDTVTVQPAVAALSKREAELPTEVSLNRLKARRMQAELAGDSHLVESLDEQIRLASPKLTLLPTDAVRDVDKDTSISEMVRYEKLTRSTSSAYAKRRVLRDSSDEAVRVFARSEAARRHCLRCHVRADDPLVVARATTCFLAVPPARLCVHPLHAIVVPYEHVPSTSSIEHADFADELRNFKKSLLRLWAASGNMTGIFTETAVHTEHVAVDAIPVQASSVDMRAYWRKALQDIEPELCLTHPPIIPFDARSGKTAASCLPSAGTFRFVSVEISERTGFGAGMLHVVEDERRVQRDYAVSLMRSLAHEASQDIVPVSERAAAFACALRPFDWTAANHS